MTEQKREWSYMTTIIKEFKLTRNQIREAIARGLIWFREVPNPHYKSSTAILIYREDVIKNLELIRSLPKHSEREKARRRYYRIRSKARGELGFFCPRCKRLIRPRRDSLMFESFFSGDVDRETALKALMIAHYRHEHTRYEKELAKIRERKYKRYCELRENGFSYEEAWEWANSDFQDEIDELKERCNQEAIQLLKEDGLLSGGK